MRIQYVLLLIISMGISRNSSSQVTTEQGMIALDEILNSNENKQFKLEVTNLIQTASEQSSFNRVDHNNLKNVYDQLFRLYNRVYIAEIKLDLTSFRQLKRLGRNPERQAKRYEDQFDLVLHTYDNKLVPMVDEILSRDLDISADFQSIQNQQDSLRLEQQRLSNKSSRIGHTISSLGLIATAFRLVSDITGMISRKRDQHQRMMQNFVNSASGVFRNAEMGEWQTLGISLPPENVPLPMKTISSYQNRAYQQEGQDLPPTDLAFLESIRGELFFEIYNKSTGEDEFMNIQQGENFNISVNDYGRTDASMDLIIGSKKGSRSVQRTTTVSQFGTSESYSDGTLYRVRAFCNGYTYVFAVNSGNRMFSIFPYQGGKDYIPSGTSYHYPENATFGSNDSDMVSISVPDGENYIEISDAPGAVAPPAETMIVLFSRSQLDLKQVFEKMEGMGSHLRPEERLANIFGSLTATPLQANVVIQNGLLTYELDENDPVVLPLVFAIKRR